MTAQCPLADFLEELGNLFCYDNNTSNHSIKSQSTSNEEGERFRHFCQPSIEQVNSSM